MRRNDGYLEKPKRASGNSTLEIKDSFLSPRSRKVTRATQKTARRSSQAGLLSNDFFGLFARFLIVVGLSTLVLLQLVTKSTNINADEVGRLIAIARGLFERQIDQALLDIAQRVKFLPAPE